MVKTQAVDITREKAVKLMRDLELGESTLSQALARSRSDALLSERDISFLHHLLKGTTEWRGSIDSVLDQKLKKGVASLTPWIRNILRLGAYQILMLDRVPDNAAVNESVKLAKKYGHQGTVKLVNAVLRSVSQEGRVLLEKSMTNEEEQMAFQFSHPQWLIKRWVKQFGKEQTIRLCQKNNESWPISLRVNTLRTNRAKLQQALAQEGVMTKEGRYSSCSLSINKLPDAISLTELSSFQSGLFQIQDESSSLVAPLLAPEPGELVLDLCSAPGGKTTHLAELMNNNGTIIALDPSEGRLKLVEENCHRLGVSIVQTVCGNGKSFSFSKQFDRVLIDAPCTGLGTIGRKKDVRWNRSETDFSELASLQGELLDNAASLLKPGGFLVYSTCSIDPEENSEVVEAFLRRHQSFNHSSPCPPLPADARSESGYLETFPHRHGIAGAFACLLRKSA